jgi:hypothetical protein
MELFGLLETNGGKWELIKNSSYDGRIRQSKKRRDPKHMVWGA